MKKYIFAFIILITFNLSTYAEAPNVVQMPASEVSSIAGHYSSTYGYIHVKPQQNGVFTHFNGRRISSVKKSDGSYYSTFKFIKIIPISLRMSLDKVNGMHRVSLDRHGVKKVVAQQFKPTPIPSVWSSRLGEYTAKAVNGKSKISRIKLDTQQGVVVIRFNNSKYAYPLVGQKRDRLVRPTIGRARQRHIEVWPNGKGLALVVGRVRFKLARQ